MAVLSPELVLEWHPDKNEKEPSEYSPYSKKKVWWKCRHNSEHEWPAVIGSRTGKNKTDCPYCAGKKVDKTNSLASLYPEIAKEWHPIKNGKLSPTDFTYGSSKKVWWICKLGHNWKTSIGNRTGLKSGCPKCRSSTSKLEIRAYTEFKTLFNEVKLRKKIDRIECDIFLPSYQVGVEIDGGYYHDNRGDKDRQKGEYLRDKGITLFRLRNETLGKIDETDTLYRYDEGHYGILKRLLETMLDNYSFTAIDHTNITDYCNSGKLRNSQEYRNKISQLPFPPSEFSLLTKYPELSKEWDYEKKEELLHSS